MDDFRIHCLILYAENVEDLSVTGRNIIPVHIGDKLNEKHEPVTPDLNVKGLFRSSNLVLCALLLNLCTTILAK